MKILRFAALAVLTLVVVGAGLYALGLRLVLDGGGGVALQFQQSAADRAAEIARHREAQRAQAPAPTPPQPPEAPAPGAGAATPDEVAAPVPDAAPRPTAAPPYWTDFRGPLRDGIYRERPIRTTWPDDGLAPLWKIPVGGGYASLVIANGRAFTIEQRGDKEVVAAYDVQTGRELWTNEWSAVFRERMGGDGPRATPTWHDGTVFALGGTGELRALEDASGRVLWRTNILKDAGASNLQWGMAASPLVVDDTVVVLPGGRGGRSVVAYSRSTGRRVWSALDDQASYSSPMLVTIDGVRQILVFTATRLAGITPGGGSVLWEFPWKTQYEVNASQPIVLPGVDGAGSARVFVSTGYGTGAAMIAVAREQGTFGVRELWRTNRMKNQFTSSVHHDGFIYGLDESILACLDATTGELKWKGGRYGYGQVMLAGDTLIVLTEGGELAIVRPTPDGHQELARFPAIEGKTWNHPAMAAGILLVRNINEMAAFDLRPKQRAR